MVTGENKNTFADFEDLPIPYTLEGRIKAEVCKVEAI